jgi:transposase
MQVTTIGLDLVKSVFQVHGVDAAGKPILVRQLRRGQVIAFFEKLPPCLIGMEACATAHRRLSVVEGQARSTQRARVPI